MAELTVSGPLAEADLGDEARIDPVHARLRESARVERRAVALNSGQRRVQAVQHAVAEPGADLARIGQLAVGVVVAEQERAQPLARALRIGVAADHELLRVLALELQPVTRPRALVRRGGALGDEAFPAVAAGLLEVP